MSTGQGVLGCNMFCYCLNNPVNGYDPTGMFDWGFVKKLGVRLAQSALLAVSVVGAAATIAGAIGGTIVTGGAGAIAIPAAVAVAVETVATAAAVATAIGVTAVAAGTIGENIAYSKSANSGYSTKPESPVKVTDYELRNVDVHKFKQRFVGRKISHWDIFKDKANKSSIWLGDKAQRVWIETKYYLSDIIEQFAK